MSERNFEKGSLNERDKGFLRMRAIMDFGMGILWMAMGVFLIFIKEFNTGLGARFDERPGGGRGFARWPTAHPPGARRSASSS